MRKLLILAILAIPAWGFSQKAEQGHFAHTSQKHDTLYLLKNDPMTTITFQIWKNDSKWNGTNPCILFVDRDTMVCLKEENVLTLTSYNK
jgi:hypothetical protein